MSSDDSSRLLPITATKAEIITSIRTWSDFLRHKRLYCPKWKKGQKAAPNEWQKVYYSFRHYSAKANSDKKKFEKTTSDTLWGPYIAWATEEDATPTPPPPLLNPSSPLTTLAQSASLVTPPPLPSRPPRPLPSSQNTIDSSPYTCCPTCGSKRPRPWGSDEVTV